MGILNNIACLIATETHGAAGTVNDVLSEWLFTAPLALVFVLFFALCVFVTKLRRAIFKHLKWIAATVFVAGIVLYFMGFNHEGSTGNVLALLLRATVSSIEMFVSETDLLEVEHHLKNDHTYMTIFAITHFSAVFVSAIVILRVFGLRLLSMLRLFTKIRHGGRLFVFWNIDDNSLAVAESIERKHGDLIVFVNVPYGRRHHEHHSSRFTFSHFFHTADDGVEQYVGRIEALGAIILAAKCKPDMVEDDVKALEFFRRLGLRRLEKVMSRYESVEFFFLSNGERNNIEALGALKKYASAGGDKQIPEDFKAYCHARRNRFNENLNGCQGLEYKTHLIDSSSLAALQLKEGGRSIDERGCNHPVNFVDVETDTATVSSVFTALVIGFGETGSDVFKFLYEFSSFIKSSVTGSDGFDDVEEQERKIYVSDINLDTLRAEFLEKAPALTGSSSVEWLDETTRTPEFWNKLKDIIDALNYVVISVDNDDEALSIGIRMFDFAYRYRCDMDKFKIYVRLHNTDDKLLVGGMDRFTVGGRRVLEVFGTNGDIFSYENISAVAAEAQAKDFFYQYSLTTVGIAGSMDADARRIETGRLMQLQPEGLWRSRRAKADGAIENAVKIEYQEDQDRSNVSHIYTKLALAGVYDGQGRVQPGRLEHLVGITTRDPRNVYANALHGTDKRLFNNLCYCEHFRWNSKMELLGFVYGDGKDFRRKLHHCLVSCNDLIRKEDTKGTFIYDQGTVELSFKKALEDYEK